MINNFKKVSFKSTSLIIAGILLFSCYNNSSYAIVARPKVSFCLVDTINNVIISLNGKGNNNGIIQGFIDCTDLKTDKTSSNPFGGKIEVRDNIEYLTITLLSNKDANINRTLKIKSKGVVVIKTDETGFKHSNFSLIVSKSLKSKKWLPIKNAMLEDCALITQ